MRIDKLLSNLKYGSRSKIKEYIKKKMVSVNGNIINNPGLNVIESDKILINNDEVFHKEKIYLALNKPSGYICANKDGMHKTVLELIHEPYNRYDLMIVGRLDIDTEGLLLITNDGEFLHEIISPRRNCYKKYYVKLANELKNYDELLSGVVILDGENKEYKTEPAIIEKISEKECFISIKEGKFHQVKRMFEYINNKVIYLKRYSIGDYELEDIGIGEYKEIEKK